MNTLPDTLKSKKKSNTNITLFITFLFLRIIRSEKMKRFRAFKSCRLSGVVFVFFVTVGQRRRRVGTADSGTTVTAETEELQHPEVWRKG